MKSGGFAAHENLDAINMAILRSPQMDIDKNNFETYKSTYNSSKMTCDLDEL